MGKKTILISDHYDEEILKAHKAVNAKGHKEKSWKSFTRKMMLLCVIVNINYLTMASAATLPAAPAFKKEAAAGNIGCLFGQTLCDQESEWCYDDYAFGRCLPVAETMNENDMYRYDLSKSDMHLLEKQMERLFAMGYRWGHLYTQCVLENLLDSIRHGAELDESVCLAVQDQDLEGALKAFQEDIDPWNLAFIKFSPSAKNPNSDFADETYQPPKEKSHLPTEELVPGKEQLLLKDNSANQRIQEKLKNPVVDFDANNEESIDAYMAEKELENTVAQVKGKNQKGKNKSGKNKNKNKNKNKPIQVKKSLLNLEYPGQSDNFNGVDIGPAKKNPSSNVPLWESSSDAGNFLRSLIANKLKMDGDAVVDGTVNEKVLQPRIFSSSYNTPDTFRIGGQSWSDPSEGVDDGDFDFGGNGAYPDSGYPGAPSYRNDDRDYRGRQEELTEEEEDQQIRKAVATLEAELLLLSLLKDNASPQNDFRGDESEQGHGSFPMDAQLPPASGGQIDLDPASLYAIDPELDDGNLLYTEGGLVFPLQNNLNLKGKYPYGQVDDEDNEQQGGLNFLKRFAESPSMPSEDDYESWGNQPLMSADQDGQDQDEEAIMAPRTADIGEFVDEYGYEIGSPLFFLNRKSRDGFGFQRRERLDVKKPGPYYRTVNNYAFDKDDNSEQINRSHMKDVNPEFGAGEGPADMMGPGNQDAAQDDSGSSDSNEPQQINKKSAPVKFDSTFPASLSAYNDPHFDVIDTSYVNIYLDKSVNWKDAKNIVDSLAYGLDFDRTNFKNLMTNDNIVTFKVEPNDKSWNATEVARRIQNLTGNIQGETGIRILRTDVGIRANSKLPSKLALYEDQDPTSNQIYVATFAVCGLVAAVLVAAVAIFLVRKHSKSREKMVRLSQDDPSFEACKDYQDLCRARMAGSKNNEKMEPIRGPAHKIASKESENGTNSSRSSTSSWSEEPVLTNMSISTGHMVLSYMEDHLKNRDRMDKEWAALCAYEADPCSTAIAEKSENSKKNRYSKSLPFDHSRVILNDLANVTGSDYINASTITDHDPRNPAYIATQGPLPNTAADFWQMVWEQGSVVIVNLTRLTENTTALCHRYWPEEGSELHHIYEVHLVSEHIWCDEYLVRSFYLKNLKTGETRTVTQFHFLAWSTKDGIPQSTKALLEFRRKVNKSYRGRSCPIIVHCSDGAGRTGTYCLIDMVLNRMTKGAKEIDIAASLEHIRDQRDGMVSTKQQFEFVLMAVAEEVHAILKALPQ